jgi:ribosomal protein S12 methylthiotransferase accessory factor
VLAFKPTLRVERTDCGVVFLIGERERAVLPGRRIAEIVPLVDGRRTVIDIVEAVRGSISEPEALFTLQKLVIAGHLTQRAPELSSDNASYWQGVGVDPHAVGDALRRTPVSVHTLGDGAPARWMVDALEQAGVHSYPEAPVRLVVTSDYLHPELAAINQRALHDRKPWCLVMPAGVRPLVGPFFEPGAGPCWSCLAFWMRNNRPVEELVRRHRGQDGPISPPRGLLEASARTVCGLASLAVARALVGTSTGSPAALSSQVLAVDMASFQITPHAVVKRPQCPTCGDPALMAKIGERPIELRSVEKAHVDDGGYRRQSPRQTYERYRHLVSPITGPVSYLVPTPGRDTELRSVYASGYLVCPRDGMPRTNVFDKVCAGKGRGAEQSRVSALCEALERWSGVYQGDEARVHASAEELGRAALPVADLLHFSETQYRTRHLQSVPADVRQGVPEPLDASTRIDWTPGWSLSNNERRYVPLGYCYAEIPPESGAAFCRANGNGVAAGTCLEEALLQALLELVERDAAAVWWYNQILRPGIDLDGFGESYFAALKADYARLGWRLWALDLTHDLGIPTVVAIAHQPEEDRFALGFGCHLEPRLAVQRALTEVNQLFDPIAARRAPWDIDRMAMRDYLFPHLDLRPVPASGFPKLGGANLHADVRQCQQRLEDAGLEVVVVDKTRPDIGLCVVQAIVPGLRHFWPRFGPGRLYDVPHALGWVPRPLAEGELNPVPLFV